MNTNQKPFGIRDKLGYLFGDLGNDFTFLFSSSFLMKFYTDVMGVSAGAVGPLRNSSLRQATPSRLYIFL